MRKVDENQAQNYIKKHRNHKRWIAFALCVALITGSTTLYMLNKPATAMTEEGAENVGLVLETADSEYEESLIQETMENKDSSASEGSASEGEEASSAGESGDVEANVSSGDIGKSLPVDASDDSTKDTLNSEETEDKSSVEASGDILDTEKTEEKVISDKDKKNDSVSILESTETKTETRELTNEEKLAVIDVPEEVNVREYVTSIIYEKQLSDGSWEVISKSEIKKGDWIKVTYLYDIPDEAKLSDDIKLDMSESLDIIDIQEVSLIDDSGSANLSDDGVLEISYSDDVKNEILDEIEVTVEEEKVEKEPSVGDATGVEKGVGDGESVIQESDDAIHESSETTSENLQSKADVLTGLKSFISGGVSFFSIFKPLRAYAAENTSGASAVGRATKNGTEAEPQYEPGLHVISADVYKTVYEWKDGKQVLVIKEENKVGENTEVSDGQELYFLMNFIIGEYTLSNEEDGQKYLEYQLPSNFKEITPVENGEIFDGEVKVGTYTISSTGVVTIMPNSDYIDKNASGEYLIGTFKFLANVDASQVSEDDSIEYKFNDDVIVKVKIVYKKDADVGVYKKESEYDEATRKITYEIQISSANGTNGQTIDFTDEITALDKDKKLDDSLTSKLLAQDFTGLTITDKNGNQINKDYQADGNKLTIKELPALLPGDYYIIKYEYVVPEVITGATRAFLNNKASVEVEGITSTPFEVKKEFTSVPEIKKGGKADNSKREVTWTITLNEKHNNLNGYILSDDKVTRASDGAAELLIPYTGKMSYEAFDSNGQKVSDGELELKDLGNGKYGYRFEQDDTNKYVLTYTVPYSYTDLYDTNGGLLNRAKIILEADDNYGNTSDAGVWGLGDQTDPFDKEGTSISGDSSDSSFLIIDWKLILKANLIRNEGEGEQKYWSYTDTLGDGQVFTDEQQSEITSAFANAFGSQNVEIIWNNQKTIGSDSAIKTGYQGYTVKVFEDLVGNNKEITYKSIAFIGDGESAAEFKNYGYVKWKTHTQEGSINYYPTIEKMDGNGSSDDTYHEFYNSDMFEQGIMTWIVAANIPAGTKGEITITDYLPNGATLLEESFEYNGRTVNGVEIATNDSFTSDYQVLNEGSNSYLGTNIDAGYNSSDREVTLTFNADNLAGRNYFIRVRAYAADMMQDGQIVATEKAYDNKVTIKGNGVTGEDHQKQTITLTENFIEKKGVASINPDKTEALDYTIEINKNASDLLPLSDELTLTDNLHAFTQNQDIEVEFKLDSFKIFEVNSENEQTELPASEYSYTLTSGTADGSFTPNGTNAESIPGIAGDNYFRNYYSVIQVKIPDKKHLIVKYTYKIIGNVGTDVYVVNDAELVGISSGKNSSQDVQKFILQDSEMSLTANALHVYKVDSEDAAIMLDGAEFELYEYTAEGNYVKVSENNYVSGSAVDANKNPIKGSFLIKNYKPNVSYKLVEVKTPEGYLAKAEPTYFSVLNADKDKYPEIKDPDFEKNGGMVYNPGSQFYIRNTKGKTNIEVEKKWEGDLTNIPANSGIDVVIKRRLGALTHESTESYHSVNIVWRDDTSGFNYINKYIGLPSVKGGSKITFSVKVHFWSVDSGAYDKVIVNGQELDVLSKCEIGNTNLQTINVTVDITQDTNIVIVADNRIHEARSKTYSITEPETDITSGTIPTVEDDFEKTIHMVGGSDGSDWHGELKNLDKYYVHTDGNIYKWMYYIDREESNIYYTARMENPAGVNEGTLVLVNTRNEIEGFELPSTGGNGTMLFALIGIGLTGSAFVGEEVTRRRKKKKNPAN